jgi:hypothetical protein
MRPAGVFLRDGIPVNILVKPGETNKTAISNAVKKFNLDPRDVKPVGYYNRQGRDEKK